MKRRPQRGGRFSFGGVPVRDSFQYKTWFPYGIVSCIKRGVPYGTVSPYKKIIAENFSIKRGNLFFLSNLYNSGGNGEK